MLPQFVKSACVVKVRVGKENLFDCPTVLLDNIGKLFSLCADIKQKTVFGFIVNQEITEGQEYTLDR